MQDINTYEDFFYAHNSLAPRNEEEWLELYQLIQSIHGGACLPSRIQKIVDEKNRQQNENNKLKQQEEKLERHHKKEYYRKRYYEEQGIADKFVPKEFKEE